jgi:toxin HigB-1
MIKTFAHKGLQRFFESGVKTGIQPHHADKLRVQLASLNQARKPEDMGVPSWRLHPLKGELQGCWSVTVNGNWRMTFRFEDGDAVLVDYMDYH